MNLSFMTFFEISNKKNHYALLGILLLLILFSSVDLALDGFPYLSTPHLGIHIGLILLYFVFILVLLQIKPENKPSEDHLHALENTEIATELTPPPADLIGLASKMNQAFNEWQLTTAEKKIATLLILGHSLKEIAENCHRGEGTVRQHATTVYKKAQLSGRAKLTAYFLQDFIDTEKLLLPSDVNRVKRHLTESNSNPEDQP